MQQGGIYTHNERDARKEGPFILIDIAMFSDVEKVKGIPTKERLSPF
jgi:hypothetical protein